MVNIPLFSLKNGNIPLDLELKYTKAGVKVNEIPNSTGINWILNTGGIITRTINDIADEKVVHNLFNLLPYITLSNPQTWGAYVLQYNDHEVDIFNFTIGHYSGSFYLDGNFQPVILTKDNNCKVEVIGSFSQNYEFKITTNEGIIYHFGSTGFTEKTLNKDDPSTAGVTSFYLKDITSTGTDQIVNFEYETGTTRQIVTGIQQNYNSDIVIISEPACGGHPLPVGGIQQNNSLLKISDPKRIKSIISEDKIISFEYSNDHILYNKLSNININVNNNLLKKYTFNYIDNLNNNVLQRYFLTQVKFYESHLNTLTLKQEYTLEYDQPLEMPARLSKSIDYLGYYNDQSNSINTLIPNINLFEGTSNPAYNNFADRRPVFELAKYGTLKSITYPTKGKTIFEYEPISEAPKDEEFHLNIGNQLMGDPISYVDIDNKELFPYEFFNGIAQISLHLRSNDVSTSPPLKAMAELEILNDLNQVIYYKSLGVSKITPGYSTKAEDEFTLDRTKKYKFRYKIKNNVCSNCEGHVTIKYKKLDIQNGPGIRLKKQYDISENNVVNIKRMYYTNFLDIPNIKKNNTILIPNFKTHFLLQTRLPNAQTSSGCYDHPTDSYPGSSTVVENLKSTPNVSSLGYNYPSGNLTEPNYFNFNDPMYSDITISFGGDQFEKGGEEKRYYVKPRNEDFTLFSPDFYQLGADDRQILGNDGILSLLTQSVGKKFYRLFSFPNVDGKLLSDKLFKIHNNNIVYNKIIENTYSFNEDRKVYNILGTDIYPSPFGDPFEIKNKFITYYPTSIDEALLSETTITDFPNSNDPNIKIITNIKNEYLNPQNQLTKQITTLADQSVHETSYAYAFEKGNQKLMNANMIGIPLETTVIKKQNLSDPGKTISKTEIKYDHATNVLPSSSLSFNVLNGTMSTEVTYDQYDNKGNLLQYTTKDGVWTAIIWGYNQSLPIVKIVGSRNFSNALINLAIQASNLDASNPANEPALLTALDNIRKDSLFSDYQITTYTYDPLIGVTSITPPSGIREVYIYDSANRLKEIRENDAAGKILKEFKYNYKN
ncbi:hypothetical protein K0U91_09040 [Chryseobacterium chendengshani]|uniref:hypothetical protein n=1 Tax=Chryseobacterium sp. LJ668 TaxID=2864040 RepID=UPI001C6933C7|nr:hypothetical protein [Chryseobacterium sp. LJ668]MBW8524868.1 hypothetical protein [Chryseobacterium sp. LJ668]QYK15223.1 hypothetical protein K0U91_09040 [Chryseobacterium sp. LJ668]